MRTGAVSRWSVVLVAVILTTLAVATAAASPATAGSGRIQQLQAADSKVRIVFGAAGLGPTVALDPSSAKVSMDGQNIAVQASLVTAQAGPVQRSVVIAIDTSGSMAGTGINGAKSAANAFLSSVPPDVSIGLITFSDTPVLRISPTLDRDAVRREIANLKAHGETALRDAALLAVQTLGAEGARNLVLLTDGGDTVSKTSPADTAARIRASKVVVDAVGFRTDESDSASLAAIAEAGGGTVAAAQGAADIGKAFAAAVRTVAGQVFVTADVPRSFAGRSVTVAVSVQAGAAALTDSAFVQLPAAPAPPPTPVQAGPVPVAIHPSPFTSRTGLLVAVAALFLGATILIGTAATSVAGGGRTVRVQRRLSIYTLSGGIVEERRETTALGDSPVARSAMELAGRVVAKRDFEVDLTRRLDAAAVPLKPAEWVIVHTAVALGLGLLLLLVSGGGVVAALLGIVVGAAGPLAYLSMRQGRRTAAFLSQLPDTLQLLASSLSVGYSFPQAVDAAVREGTQPVSGELNRALVQTRLGVTIEDALEDVADRMRSKDFAWVVMAVRIQREVGGNLATVLTTVADTLRERERLRRQVKALSAEGRLSAYILGGLPVVFALYLLLVRPDYIRPLYTDPFGIALSVVMLTTLAVGALWLRKVVRVDV